VKALGILFAIGGCLFMAFYDVGDPIAGQNLILGNLLFLFNCIGSSL